MALRVLLADESASIRKVFQLGLQDYGAEVKSVHSGLDVIQVAEQFQPHIIFADILLQKKNGYEVSEEIRQHASLDSTPIVLMWSSFMELDQKKYKECQASGEMEKPFEVDTMRAHIQNFVQETKEQQLSSFLTFPENIKKDFVEEFEEKRSSLITPDSSIEGMEQVTKVHLREETAMQAQREAEEDAAAETAITSIFNADIENFHAELEDTTDGGIAMVPMETISSPAPKTTIEDQWETKALSDSGMALTPPPKTEDVSEKFETVELSTEDNLKLDDFLFKPEKEGLAAPKPPPIDTVSVTVPNPTTNITADINMDKIEAIVRAHTQEVIKLNIQEMLPKIIEKIAREELEKILQYEMASSGEKSP